jgi:hypothetical protein
MNPAVITAIEKSKSCIVWDLKAVRHLMRVLKLWALNKVPGHVIGAFLKLVLYGRDYHINEMVTKMVTEGKSNLYIAREVMAFYQIWDDSYRFPLWTTLVDDNGADETLTAPGPAIKQGQDQNVRSALAEANVASSAIAAAEHARRVAKQMILTEWPLFVSDLNDVQIDKLVYHLENGEKGTYGPLLYVPENLNVIKGLRGLNRYKKDTRENLNPV